MYLAARQWGIQPSEFWEMTMSEWYCEFELHIKDAPGAYAGKLTNGVVDDMVDDMQLTDAEWWGKHGSSSNQG